MPNFIRNEKKDFIYSKHKFSLKNKKPFINFKRHNEWHENNVEEKPKWIKVTCKTETPNCMQDLIRELEEIVFRYGNNRVNFKAINPMFSGGRLDFYIEVMRAECKILYRNYSYIKKYDIKCVTFDDINMPPVFPQDWINLMMQALDKRFSKNEATGETTVDLSNFANDRFMKEQGLLLKMSNPNVMKHVLNMFKETNLKIITRLNLSKNDISNTFQLESFFERCSVYHVDLSDNRLNRTSDLAFMAKNAVTSLNIANNDFTRKMNPKKMVDEIRKMLPRLTVLNEKPLPAAVIIAGDLTSTKKSLPETIYSDKNSDVHREFVTKYCQAFDSCPRDALCEFYSSESTMSLDCFTEEMPYCYRTMNSNLRSRNFDMTDKFKKGKAAIVGAFTTFPKTKHIAHSLNVDIAMRTDSVIMFSLTGVFIEMPEKSSKTYRPRQFSRSFVIHNGIVLQDHISLMPTDSNLVQKFKPDIEKIKELQEIPLKYKEELEGISAEAVQIVSEFKVFSGMTIKACLEFLSFANNLTDAMEKFSTMKAQGGIPNEAYECK